MKFDQDIFPSICDSLEKFIRTKLAHQFRVDRIYPSDNPDTRTYRIKCNSGYWVRIIFTLENDYLTAVIQTMETVSHTVDSQPIAVSINPGNETVIVIETGDPDGFFRMEEGIIVATKQLVKSSGITDPFIG